MCGRAKVHARDIYDTDHCNDELQDTLTSILGGVQGVPTLLLLNQHCPNFIWRIILFLTVSHFMT